MVTLRFVIDPSRAKRSLAANASTVASWPAPTWATTHGVGPGLDRYRFHNRVSGPIERNRSSQYACEPTHPFLFGLRQCDEALMRLLGRATWLVSSRLGNDVGFGRGATRQLAAATDDALAVLMMRCVRHK